MDEGGQKVIKIIERLMGYAHDHGRSDLAARLGGTAERVTDPRARVVVVGRQSQGKSQLINALLNVPACRVGDGKTTQVITVIGNGAEPAARLVVTDGESDRTVPFPIDDVTRDLDASAVAGGGEITRVEIDIPSPLLAQGLLLIDTPGTGGVGAVHAGAALGLLPTASGIVICSDVSQEYTAPEMTFIRQALDLCPKAFLAATKVDVYPFWRDVIAADTAHLRAAGFGLTPQPLSSALRAHAVAVEDAELNTESGYPELLRFLTGEVIANARTDMQAAVKAEIASAVAQLSLAVRSQLTVASDPSERDRIVAELERAKAEAKDRASRTALWQQVLGDGIADLSADADHDLRGRARALLKAFEEEIDAQDPYPIWADLTERIQQAASEAVGDNFIWTHRQSVLLAGRVAESFADTGVVALPEVELASIGGSLEPIDPLAALEQAPAGLGHKLITGLRGGYGGMMMFGMLSSAVVVGLHMINPFSVATGAALGWKSYKEDQEMRLARRRGEAKLAIRKLIDDVQFEASRESRERLRTIQRVLRDHFRVIAEETTRSLAESIASTEAVAKAQVADRDLLRTRLEQELAFLREVSAWAGEVSA